MKILTLTLERYEGTPAQIVRKMRRASRSRSRNVRDFMRQFARRCRALNPTAQIRCTDESYFLIDSSTYGFLKLLPSHKKPTADEFPFVPKPGEEVPIDASPLPQG